MGPGIYVFIKGYSTRHPNRHNVILLKKLLPTNSPSEIA